MHPSTFCVYVVDVRSGIISIMKLWFNDRQLLMNLGVSKSGKSESERRMGSLYEFDTEARLWPDRLAALFGLLCLILG